MSFSPLTTFFIQMCYAVNDTRYPQSFRNLQATFEVVVEQKIYVWLGGKEEVRWMLNKGVD
jgi:hypothetical protein